MVVGNRWIVENASGLLTSHVHMCTRNGEESGGGNVAEGRTATLHVLDVSVRGIRFNHDPADCTVDAVTSAGTTPGRTTPRAANGRRTGRGTTRSATWGVSAPP